MKHLDALPFFHYRPTYAYGFYQSLNDDLRVTACVKRMAKPMHWFWTT